MADCTESWNYRDPGYLGRGGNAPSEMGISLAEWTSCGWAAHDARELARRARCRALAEHARWVRAGRGRARVAPMSVAFTAAAAAAAAEWRAARAAAETEHSEGCALWRAAWEASRVADAEREASALAALAASDEARAAAGAAADAAWGRLRALVGDDAPAWVRP